MWSIHVDWREDEQLQCFIACFSIFLCRRRSIVSPIKTAPIYYGGSTDKEQRNRQRANEKHGAYAFHIHESAHHLMSPELIPNPNNAIQQPNGIENIQIIFRIESDTDIRRYNAPTADEIGVLIVGGEDESSI
ncbi:hypothetical protein MAM1_0241d08583 [Mucor ambiguus]|uniref:Uncharacterized protein n=1 Tax=Mucor ambiguus TaxID=91626 RepID=A0A0C9MEE0_9FUNG|nr:hypothetical protein MAM1_0241d08583 [Mucor ambiguus]